MQGGTVFTPKALVNISVVIAGLFARAFCMKNELDLQIGKEASVSFLGQGLVWRCQ